MQRRWAAVCIAFFLVMGASAYSVMALADAPTPDVEGDTYDNGSTFQEGGTTYSVSASKGNGELSYEETVEKETAFQNNTEVEYANGTYNVSIEAGNDSNSFTLVQSFDIETILENDPQVENSTFTRDDGTEVVVYRNGTTQPLEEYVDRDRETLAEGDTIQHANTTKTVANVTSERALLRWEAEENKSISLKEGATFTINDEEHVATFPDNDTVVIGSGEAVKQYEEYENNVAYYQERKSGLLYVVIFSGGSSFLLAALAFLPHRG